MSAAQSGESVAALISAGLPGLDADTVYRLIQAGVHPIAIDGDPARCAALGIPTLLSVAELPALAGSLPREPSRHLDDSPPELAGAGALVAVWGPAGAPGRSTVALGLADALASRGSRLILADADPHGGAIAQMLGMLDEVSGLLAASRAANDGRVAELSQHLYALDRGFSVLTGLPRPDLWSQVRAGAYERLLQRLRREADVSVIDAGFCLEDSGGFDSAAPRRNQLTVQSLETADHIIAVGRADPVGLTRLVRGLHDLETVIPTARISVVINMTRQSIGWPESEIAATLERLTARSPEAFLPLDQVAVDAALINGRTLGESQPDSRLAKAMDRFAAEWSKRHLDAHAASSVVG